MLFIDQSAANLQLSIYDGDVDLSALSIIKEQQLELSPTLSLHAGIIGASHFIKIQYGSEFFTEIFACTQLENFHQNQLYQSAKQQLKDVKIDRLSGLHYTFQHEYFSLADQEKVYKELSHRRKQLSASSVDLVFNFPTADALSIPAKTILLLEVQEDVSTLTTFTIHEYPQEEMIVVNRSLFELP